MSELSFAYAEPFEGRMRTLNAKRPEFNTWAFSHCAGPHATVPPPSLLRCVRHAQGALGLTALTVL